jgi:hypothetical protein
MDAKNEAELRTSTMAGQHTKTGICHTKTGILAILRCSEFRQHNVYPPTNTRIYRTICHMAGLFPRLQNQYTFSITNGDHRATLVPWQQTDKYDAWSSDAKCPILYRITNGTIATSKHLN